eukprot:scaffold278312_cov33-Tisochrysis_lutea.AAC.2
MELFARCDLAPTRRPPLAVPETFGGYRSADTASASDRCVCGSLVSTSCSAEAGKWSSPRFGYAARRISPTPKASSAPVGEAISTADFEDCLLSVTDCDTKLGPSAKARSVRTASGVNPDAPVRLRYICASDGAINRAIMSPLWSKTRASPDDATKASGSWCVQPIHSYCPAEVSSRLRKHRLSSDKDLLVSMEKASLQRERA